MAQTPELASGPVATRTDPTPASACLSAEVDAASRALPRTSRSESIAAGFLRRQRLGILGIILVLMVVPAVEMTVIHRSHVRPPHDEIIFSGIGFVVWAICLMITLRDGSVRPLRWPLLVTVFVVGTAEAQAIPAAHLLSAPQTVYPVVGWFAVLLLEACPLLVVGAVLALHEACRVALLEAAGALGLDQLTGVAFKAIVLVALQIVASYSIVAVRRMAQEVAREAEREERLQIAQAVAEQVSIGRQARYAALQRTTLPLLAALASGTRDAGEDDFRRACAIECARLRRLFAENDDTPDPLEHELQSCIGLAERNGVQVWYAARGERPDIPLDIRRALLDPIVLVLTRAMSTARVTLIGRGNSVQLNVVATLPPNQVEDVIAEVHRTRKQVTINVLTMEEGLWVQASW